MMDQFFTPENIAKSMVASVKRRKQAIIADFAAGDGELLRVAAKRWPAARILATEIDEKCVARVRRGNKTWQVHRCDILHAVEPAKRRRLLESVGRVTLILLNPPFTSRGGSRVTVEYFEEKLQCSRALAFVIRSIPFLHKDGSLVAVLPASTLKAQKDDNAWKQIRKDFCVQIIRRIDRTGFSGCAVHCVVVSLRRRLSVERHSTSSKRRRNRSALIFAQLTRGTLPCHIAANGHAGPGFKFVHTTDLRKFDLRTISQSVRQASRFIVGPCCLLPRVGRPSISQIAECGSASRFVVSDCIFAIQCTSMREVLLVRERIVRNWRQLELLYRGTCAPYLTMRSLTAFLRSLGVVVAAAK